MGEKRKISLSSTHKQAGEESNKTQTSFDLSITQAEATIFTLGLERFKLIFSDSFVQF